MGVSRDRSAVVALTGGVERFSTHQHDLQEICGDSLIYFCKDHLDPRSGRIQEIGCDSASKESILLVDVYKELSEDELLKDVYWQGLNWGPDMPCAHYYDTFQAEPVILTTTNIIGHAACCLYIHSPDNKPLSQPSSVFLSLDRVRLCLQTAARRLQPSQS